MEPALIRRLRGLVDSRQRISLSMVDPTLLVTVLALCAFGLVMVYSASDALGYLWFGNSNYFFERQAVWMVLGIIAMVVFSRIDYHVWSRYAGKLALLTLALLVLVLVPHIGSEVSGSRRWFAFGSVTIQPSVFAALGGIVFLSKWLVARGDAVRSWRCVRDYMILTMVVLGLVILEKDMGTTVILAATAVAILFAAGVRVSHLLVIGGILVALALAAIAVEPYRAERITAYFNPFAHALTSGFQAVQSQLALGSGGLTGVGLGNSVQKYGWLPQAHTDFIFAIIGEELGLVGTFAVLLAFSVFAWRGFVTARRAKDAFGGLVAAGITAWVCAEAFINMAAVTGLIPTTGVPLPFISYGGSSLAATLVGVGILFNISAQSGRRGGVTEREVVDSWGRHRRTPLASGRARPGIPAGQPR